MTAQSKTTIKTYFETGDRPTEAQFIDFIDSYQDAATNLGVLTSASLGTAGLSVLAAVTSASARSAIDAVNRGGDTMTGKLNIVAGTSAGAGINIGVGVSPAAPSNGDLWVNASAAFIQVGASAYQIAPLSSTITESLYNPAVSAGTSGGITLDTAADTGSYERIGNTVFVRGKLIVASVSSPTGTIRIGLPLPAANLTDSAGGLAANVAWENTVASAAGVLTAIVEEGTAVITCYIPTSTAFTGSPASQAQASTTIYYSAIYRTS